MCRSELCSIPLGQNAIEMQGVGATVGWFGPNRGCWIKAGSQSGQTGSNMDHMGHPGHVEVSVSHVCPMGHVGHWASEFVQNGY